MKFISYEKNKEKHYGIILEEDDTLIYEIPNITKGSNHWNEMEEIYTFLMKDTETIKTAVKSHNQTVNVNECTLVAPISTPRHDVICVGLNYKDHVKECHKELDFKAPEEPTYFSKRASHIYSDGDDLNIHNLDEVHVDYEVELAVIIGKSGVNIPPEQVKNHILGYAVYNDLSARTVQKETSQWYRGKSLDGLSAMSSAIVLAQELPYPPEFPIKSTVNGEVRQDSNTDNFIHSIDYLISRFSQGCTIEAGDIFLTGTPAGVGMGMEPPVYLKAGDSVTCEIQGIGTLTNQFV